MKTVCIYYSIDLDGFMSAAIVKHWFNQQEVPTNKPGVFNTLDFLGYNYGQPIPDLSEYDKVIMCDVSFPKDEMTKLKEEVIKCLKESIYELSVDEKKCFISYYYYTKTIAVIAEETGLKESTVKSKLLRGRKKLKLKMEKKGFRYEDCKIFFE